MIVLDTNVVSELMRAEPEPRVFAFVDARPRNMLFTTTIVQAEILSGVAMLPMGRRRTALQEDAERLFSVDFAGRVLPFDEAAAIHFAAIRAARRAAGRPVASFDSLVAATARAHGAIVATRNTSDFRGCGVDVIDPWSASH
ncbi:type II toxin-antitoxin system VapC family toxin [Salinarimonas sp.]|uniref:type II toxin-antitoxin system VapC family toxin n=1 Tax=Salinarimonas sp. TaxID=2766526 RepID=UPI0032D8FA5B